MFDEDNVDTATSEIYDAIDLLRVIELTNCYDKANMGMAIELLKDAIQQLT